MRLRKISWPMLQELRDLTGETSNLGILDGQDVFYVDFVQSRHPFRMASRSGTLRPLYCTAMGKALVALSPATEKEPVLASLRFERFTPRTITHLVQLKEELVKTQKRGCAVDDEEATLGARCVSTPIFLECGKLVAAVGVSGPRARMASRKIPLLVSAVQRAAKTISVRLTAAGLQ